jgi:hypothetical protein
MIMIFGSLLVSLLQKIMKPEQRTDFADSSWLGAIKDHVESLRFGTVQIVVHEARVVQIEKTEKIRFDKLDRSHAGNGLLTVNQL